MKLANHVVLAFGLACTGGTFDAGAASPNTTPQPPQAIPAPPVPTVAAGPNVPTAQAKDGSKDAVEAIKTISAAAIKSAEDDVETVKWIFVAMASLAALLSVLGLLLSFLGFKTFKESRELVQKKAEEESENLSALRSSIGPMMTFQNFIIVNHPILTLLGNDIRAMQPSDKGYSEKKSQLKSVVEQIIDDLNRMREHDKELNRVAPKPGTTLGGLDKWLARVNAALGRTKRTSDPLPGSRDPTIERAASVGEEPQSQSFIQPGLLLRSLGDKR